MKIALAFFGLPRATHITFPSIERQLIAPLAALGDLRIVHHFWRQQHVFNPRSGENDPVPESAYAPFLRFEGTLQDRPEIESDLLRRLKAGGDAWDDGFRSLTNCVLQLQSLLAVTEWVAGEEPDVVVFARPDLLYHEPLPAREVLQALAQPDVVALPCWESWGGYNDRFAIAGARAYRSYGGRLLLAEHFCEHARRPLHAETLLRYALAFAGVPVRTIGFRASRVRLGGWMESEDFEGLRTPLVRQAGTSPPGP